MRGSGLPQEALQVFEAGLETVRFNAPRHVVPARGLVATFHMVPARGLVATFRSNMANCLVSLDRADEALQIRREVRAQFLELYGEADAETLRTAHCLLGSLIDLGRRDEAQRLALETIAVAKRVLGYEHVLTLNLVCALGDILICEDRQTVWDLDRADAAYMLALESMRRVLGTEHPITRECERKRARIQSALARVPVEERLRENERQTAMGIRPPADSTDATDSDDWTDATDSGDATDAGDDTDAGDATDAGGASEDDATEEDDTTHSTDAAGSTDATEEEEGDDVENT